MRIATVLVPLLAFVAVIALAGVAIEIGFVADDAVTLWANAIAAGEGHLPIGRILSAYPTIPFFATSLLEFLTPVGTPAPVLLSAAIVALLAWIFVRAFGGIGIPPLAAATASLLIALHPTLLRAAAAGPADVFLALFVFMLARSLYDLRARSAAPEVMAAALALLGLTFAHPLGAALACATVPFLIFAVRTELVAGSDFYVVLALVFPSLFCVAGFVYMSWVFQGSGWSFLVPSSEALATWSAGLARLGFGAMGALPVVAAAAAVCGLALGAPLVFWGLAFVRRRKPLVAPAAVMIAAMVVATAIAVATGSFGDPTALAVLAPILAGVIILRLPPLRSKCATVLSLLAIGWIGGLAGLVIVDPGDTAKLGDAIAGRGFDAAKIAAIGLGNATIGRDGVLVDTFDAPAVVLGRGRTQGLVSPADDDFALTLMFSRIDAPFVAVPDPLSSDGAQDRLDRAFPFLYQRGAPGYRLIYQNASWRLFARAADREGS